MSFIFVAIAAMFLLHPADELLAKEPTLRVCYIPFGLQTFVPVTISDIGQKCMRVGEVDLKDDRILSLRVDSEEVVRGTFDNDVVRAKLTEAGQNTIYIDNNGVVLIGGKESQLSVQSFKRVEWLMESLTDPAHSE